jgi:rhodanese-related sulfurtransferase
MERLIEFIASNLFWVSLWFALLMLLLWNLFGHALLGINEIGPMDVTRLINHEHAAVIDVRTEPDYEAGHILNAINIPEAELPDRKQEMEKFRNKPVVVYCQNGAVSPRVARSLKTSGYANVSCIKGGLATWQKAGLPLTRGGKRG